MTTIASPSPKAQKNRRQFYILAGLLVLCIVPVAGGIVRLVQLTGSAQVTPENARFFASPLPVMLHIIAIIPYSILGAFQFIPRVRRSWPRWHRVSGWLLIPSGLVVALSGLWMTLFYPWPAGDGVALYLMRLVVSPAILFSILMGVVMIRQRNFFAHGAWMLRGYALAMGAGTQVLTHLPHFLLYGSETPSELSRTLIMGTGWLINIALAEWIIYRRIGLPQRRSMPKARGKTGAAQPATRMLDAGARLLHFEKRALLSTLWIFVLFNIAFRDIHEIFRVGFLAEILGGTANGTPLTEELLLAGGLLMEIPILMVLLARILPYAANRWANIVAGSLMTATVFLNSVHDLDDIFFAAVQVAALLVIVVYAWRWSDHKPTVTLQPATPGLVTE